MAWWSPLIFYFKILVVIEPLLIDEDYYARVEGREIISNLAKVRIHFHSHYILHSIMICYTLIHKYEV